MAYHSGNQHENYEGISSADIPPIGEPSEDLPF